MGCEREGAEANDRNEKARPAATQAQQSHGGWCRAGLASPPACGMLSPSGCPHEITWPPHTHTTWPTSWTPDHTHTPVARLHCGPDVLQDLQVCMVVARQELPLQLNGHRSSQHALHGGGVGWGGYCWGAMGGAGAQELLPLQLSPCSPASAVCRWQGEGHALCIAAHQPAAPGAGQAGGPSGSEVSSRGVAGQGWTRKPDQPVRAAAAPLALNSASRCAKGDASSAAAPVPSPAAAAPPGCSSVSICCSPSAGGAAAPLAGAAAALRGASSSSLAVTCMGALFFLLLLFVTTLTVGLWA